jgi:hypothetical protein
MTKKVVNLNNMILHNVRLVDPLMLYNWCTVKYALVGERIGGWCSILKARSNILVIALVMNIKSYATILSGQCVVIGGIFATAPS